MVGGQNGGFFQIQQLFLNAVNGFRLHTDWRQYRSAVFFRHADDHITAAQIVKIVGKGAQRVQDCFRISACFVFNALAFHGAAVEQIININR